MKSKLVYKKEMKKKNYKLMKSLITLKRKMKMLIKKKMDLFSEGKNS